LGHFQFDLRLSTSFSSSGDHVQIFIKYIISTPPLCLIGLYAALNTSIAEEKHLWRDETKFGLNFNSLLWYKKRCRGR
jgi:hypothetical protein